MTKTVLFFVFVALLFIGVHSGSPSTNQAFVDWKIQTYWIAALDFFNTGTFSGCVNFRLAQGTTTYPAKGVPFNIPTPGASVVIPTGEDAVLFSGTITDPALLFENFRIQIRVEDSCLDDAAWAGIPISDTITPVAWYNAVPLTNNYVFWFHAVDLSWMQFSLQYSVNGLLNPVVGGIFPQGLELPPLSILNPILPSTAAPSGNMDASLSKSLFIAGPQIDGGGASTVTPSCVFKYERPQETTVNYSPDADKAEVGGSVDKKFAEIVEIPAIVRESDYFPTIRSMYPAIDNYDTPALLRQWPKFLECPNYLFELGKQILNQSRQHILWKVGVRLVVEANWHTDDGKDFPSEDLNTFLFHGAWSRVNVSIPTNVAMSKIATIEIQSEYTDGQSSNTPPLNYKDGTQDMTISRRKSGTDEFYVAWESGAVLNPTMGINSFPLTNQWDGTYTMDFSIDFSGTYCVNVFRFVPATGDMQSVLADRSCKSIRVDGPGITVANTEPAESSSFPVAWATTALNSRGLTPFFDPGLSKYVAGNKGSAVSLASLGPLFQRWGRGWFQQRESISLAFEWPMEDVDKFLPQTSRDWPSETILRTLTVYQLNAQGTTEPTFCNQHVDNPADGELSYFVYPWQYPRSWAGTNVRDVSVPKEMENTCATDVIVNVFLRPKVIPTGTVPLYNIYLEHNQKQVILSNTNLNVIFSGEAAKSCCETTWCGTATTPSPITFDKYDQAWESSVAVFDDNHFICEMTYANHPTNPIWTTSPASNYQELMGCQFSCLNASGTIQCDTTEPSFDCPPAGWRDKCCEELFCSIPWTQYKQKFGPKGAPWDDGNFVCQTYGTWPASYSGSDFNWKNDSAIDARCTFDCLQSAESGWSRSCSVDTTTCKYAAPGNATTPSFGSNCASFPAVITNPSLTQKFCFGIENVPELNDFLSGSLSGEWKLGLEVFDPDGIGAFIDWNLEFKTRSCYALPGIPTIRCATGTGTSADEVGTDVKLTCPPGTVITEIYQVLYGQPEGDCASNYTDPGGCTFDGSSDSPELLDWIQRKCLGTDICTLSADPALVGPPDYDYTCPQIRCNARSNQLCDAPPSFLKIKARCALSSAAHYIAESSPMTQSPEPELYVASVSANLDGDTRIDVFSVYARKGGCLNVAIKTIVGPSFGGGTIEQYTWDWCFTNVSGSSEAMNTSSPIKLVAGDFDEDGYDEVVVAFVDQNGNFQGYVWDLDANVRQPECETLYGSDCIWMGGQFDSTQWENDRALRRSFDNAKPLVFCRACNPGRILPSTSSIGSSFDLAAGDIDFNINSELVLAWINPLGVVTFQVFDWDYVSTGPDTYLRTLVGQPAPPLFTLTDYNNPRAITIALGNWLGTGYATLEVIVWDDTAITLQHITSDWLRDFRLTGVSRIQLAQFDADSAPASLNHYNLRSAVGDLNGDDDHELVVVYSTRSDGHVMVFDIDPEQPSNGLILRAFTAFPLAPSTSERGAEILVDIGNIDDSRSEEIVIAAEYRSTQITEADSPTRVEVLGFACTSTECTSLRALGIHCYHGPGYVSLGSSTEEAQNLYIPNNIGLTVGNFYGRGLRVLLPEYWRFEGVPALIAVISAPPTHLDYFDGTAVIVNANTVAGKSGSYASNRNTEGLVSQFDYLEDDGFVETTIDGTAVDVNVMVAFFHFDWQKLIQDSELTTKGHASVGKVALTKAITASQDDIVVYILNTYDIWRYPLVDWTGATIGKLEIRIPSSCGDDCITQTSGRQLRWYRPDHQVFNILSYPATAPADFQTANRIFVGDKLLVGLNPNEIYLDSSFDTAQVEAETHDDQTLTQYNINAALGVTLGWEANITPLGVGATLKSAISIKAGYQHQYGKRTQDTIRSFRQATFTKVATIHVAFEGILPKFSYWVQPFAYYTHDVNNNKYYKVDYTVEPHFEPGLTQWWQEVYDKPDPTFNLPWAFADLHSTMTMYTKEMTYSPNPPLPGQAVTVKFTIRNYSPIEARGVEVRFWKGDPQNCRGDANCLLDALISTVPPVTIIKQGKTQVERRWLFDGIQSIYATIDSLNLIDEVHEDNNMAYGLIYTTINPELTRAQLANLEIGTGIGYLLRTMELSAAEDEGNVFIGQFIEGYHLPHAYIISVMITGDSFNRNNVPVAFYLGDPTSDPVNAKLIANVLVPTVVGQNRTIVTGTWDIRSIYGPKTVTVFILHSTFTVVANNIVSRLTLQKNVGCFVGWDPCGICGGDGTTCVGCDGIVNSGVSLDGCGVCGGDGSSCCLRLDQWVVTLKEADAPQVLSIKVGDTVFWENQHTQAHTIIGVGGDDRQEILQRTFTVDPNPNYALGYDLARVAREAPPDIQPLSKFFSGQSTRRRAVHDVFAKPILHESSILFHKNGLPKLTSAEQYNFKHHRSALKKRVLDDSVGEVFSEGVNQMFTAAQRTEEVLQEIKDAQNPKPAKKKPTIGGIDSGITVASPMSATPLPTLIWRVPVTNSYSGAGPQGLGGYTAVSKILFTSSPDTSAMLQPGGGSYGLQFSRPGVYQWVSNEYPAIRGSIYVTFSKPPLQMDACGVCGGDNSSCVDCAGVPFGTAVLDKCLICSGGNTGIEPGSTLDCADVCDGSATYDECGSCTGGSTGKEPGEDRDCFGNCSGPGKVYCGQCFNFTNFLPGVDLSIALGIPYELLPFDCFGTCKRNYSNTTQMAYLNDCGICVDGATGIDANAAKDCYGSCFGQARYDRCGFCYGGNSTRLQTPFGDPCSPLIEAATRRGVAIVTTTTDPIPCRFDNDTGVAYFEDCAGECNGTAIVNECNECVLGSTGRDINYRRDCAGSCGGSAALDDCGVCAGGTTTVLPNLLKDCTGLCNGIAFYDDCGTCSGGTTEHIANSGKDCAGTCNGTAVYDDCGVCTLGRSGREYNQNKDCAGQCFGSHKPTDRACNCPTPLDGCYVCGGDNSTCAGCDGIPWSGLQHDYCGVCDGDNSGCCYSEDSGAHTTLTHYGALPSAVSVVAGEPVYFHNLDKKNSYTLVISDIDKTESRMIVVTRGNIEAVSFPHPSKWTFTALEYNIVQGSIDVYDYNTNRTYSFDGVCRRVAMPRDAPEVSGSQQPTPNSGSRSPIFLTDVFDWFVSLFSGLLN